MDKTHPAANHQETEMDQICEDLSSTGLRKSNHIGNQYIGEEREKGGGGTKLTIIMQPRSVDRKICTIWDRYSDAFSFTVLCHEKCVFLAVLWDHNRLYVSWQ